ncbi:MAG: hypothetical protein ABI771_12255 [Betaproteobacteria bacterium]
MRRFGIGVLCGIGGYLLAAVAGYFLIEVLSSNGHDRSVEAGMTSVFFFGPLGGLIAFIVGVIFGGRRTDPASSER